MIVVNFIQHDGKKVAVEAESGKSLMEIAVENNVRGIDADCGGACSCATCHVYISQEWLSVIGKPKIDEASLLNLNPDRKDNSRLSCQIEISSALDGLTVHLPEFQF